MPSKTDLTLLGSRRAYEFKVDEIRLTALVVPQVAESIRSNFNFQTLQIVTPQETFGTVPNSFPPGLVFDLGVAVAGDGVLIPIRFLHFEQKRIVIDIAGESSAIDRIYTQLVEIVKLAVAPRRPPIGDKPTRILNFSEFSGNLPFSLLNLVVPEALSVLQQTFVDGSRPADNVLLPALFLRHQPSHVEFSGMSVTAIDSLTFQLAPRAGSFPGDQIWYSGAPLDSKAHLDFLMTLSESVRKSRERPAQIRRTR